MEEGRKAKEDGMRALSAIDGEAWAREQHPITGAHMIFYQAKARMARRVQKEGIDLWICYCRRGRVLCQKENGATTCLQPGQTALMTKRAAQRPMVFPLGEYEGMELWIATGKLNGFLDQTMGLQLPLPSLQSQTEEKQGCVVLPTCSERKTRLDALWNEWERKRRLLELLLSVGDDLDPLPKEKAVYFTEETVARTLSAADRLRKNLEIDLPLPQLAQETGIGLSTLKKCFKELTGETLYAHRRRYRMEWAAQQLQTGEESIAQIARQVGYENFGKFSAAFRTCQGKLPRNYRREHRFLDKS